MAPLRALIAPDAYKGSLTAKDVAETIAAAAGLEWPELQCILAPLADGGEGTIDALIEATQGHTVNASVTGPMGDRVETCYGVLGDGITAVLEIASVAGLPMVPFARRDPRRATTRGLGELLRKALDDGFRHFIVGLGGSATNDGGMGFLQALGTVFYDQSGLIAGSFTEDLKLIKRASFHALDPRLQDCSILIASDVDNPLCGASGATFVYGPQKGITSQELFAWDQAMARYASGVEEALDRAVQNRPGAGAAGGMGFALLALGATVQPGAAVVSQYAKLADHLKMAAFVITGEGQSDTQTLAGKLPAHVAKLATQRGLPVLLLSGSLGDDCDVLYNVFSSLHSTISRPMPLDEAIKDARAHLFQAARNLFRTLKMAAFSLK